MVTKRFIIDTALEVFLIRNELLGVYAIAR
jgi:hypothetical protein